MIDRTKIEDTLAKIIWDYEAKPYDLYLVLKGKMESAGPFTAEKIFIRMLERLSWYDLLDILGIEYLTSNLTRELIEKIRFNELKDKYEFIRKILQREAVSFSGWGAEYREKIESTLLSNRWYRTG